MHEIYNYHLQNPSLVISIWTITVHFQTHLTPTAPSIQKEKTELLIFWKLLFQLEWFQSYTCIHKYTYMYIVTEKHAETIMHLHADVCIYHSVSIHFCIVNGHKTIRTPYLWQGIDIGNWYCSYWRKNTYLTYPRTKLAFCHWQKNSSTTAMGASLEKHPFEELKEICIRGVNETDFQCTRLEEFSS